MHSASKLRQNVSESMIDNKRDSPLTKSTKSNFPAHVSDDFLRDHGLTDPYLCASTHVMGHLLWTFTQDIPARDTVHLTKIKIKA